MAADGATGLPYPDVFYFGNAVGESGNDPTNAIVDSADEDAARNDPHSFLNPAPVTNAHDYNRDGRVDATDQIIARNNGTTADTALALITTVPTAPYSLTAAAISDKEIDLNWSVPPSTEDGFIIEESTDGGSTYSQLAQTTDTTPSYQATQLAAGTTYTFRVRAYSSIGSSDPSNAATATTFLVSSATNLLATAVSTTEIDLSWTTTATGVTGIEVWRSTDGTNYSLSGTLPGNATTYSDTGLAESSIYDYEVRVLVGATQSGFAQAAMTTFPAAPSNLSATAASDGTLDLSWTNNSQGEGGFFIYRSIDGSTFEQVGSAEPDATTYNDWDAPSGVTVYYEVRALNIMTESVASGVVSAMPLIPLRLGDDTPANNITYQATHNQTLTMYLSSLLANDDDPNGHTVLLASYTNPSHGTLTYDPGAGTFSYTPSQTYGGPDSFTYTATDDLGATSNTATVGITVNEHMPEASSVLLTVTQYQDANGNYYPYPAGDEGTVTAWDADSDPLTYRIVAQPPAGEGSVTMTSDGHFAFTPSQSYQGEVSVAFVANDGIVDSNQASITFPGWALGEDDPNEPPDSDGDEVVSPPPLPTVAANSTYSVNEGGTLQVYAPGLLGSAFDEDPPPDSDSLSVDSSLVEQVHHGVLESIGTDGGFRYHPDPGFVGRDWFTYLVDDGSRRSPYATAFIDVSPTVIGLNVDALKTGAPTASLPPGPFGYEGDVGYATLYLTLPWGSPDGTTVTLSADTSDAINVWDNAPDGPGATELFGHDLGTEHYTWTVDSSTNTRVPGAVYVVGRTPTDYDQVMFHLSVVLGVQTVNAPAGQTPAAPTTQPVAATQPATVPGNEGFLEAFDGTWDVPERNTNIYIFYNQHYKPATRHYHEGVGAKERRYSQLHGSALAAALAAAELDEALNKGISGNDEAKRLADAGFKELHDFYQDPTHQHIPVDLIGYSRGSYEAAKVATELADGIPDDSTRYTDSNHVVQYRHRFFPPLRFVGLLSPVAKMQNGFGGGVGDWPSSIPGRWKYFYQALDNNKRDVLFTETQIDRQAPTQGGDRRFDEGKQSYNHHQIGIQRDVLDWLIAQANTAQVPTM